MKRTLVVLLFLGLAVPAQAEVRDSWRQVKPLSIARAARYLDHRFPQTDVEVRNCERKNLHKVGCLVDFELTTDDGPDLGITLWYGVVLKHHHLRLRYRY